MHSTADTEAADAVDLADLSEGEFLAAICVQLASGQRTPTVRLSDADLAAMEAEAIGEHFSRYPFLY